MIQSRQRCLGRLLILACFLAGAANFDRPAGKASQPARPPLPASTRFLDLLRANGTPAPLAMALSLAAINPGLSARRLELAAAEFAGSAPEWSTARAARQAQAALVNACRVQRDPKAFPTPDADILRAARGLYGAYPALEEAPALDTLRRLVSPDSFHGQAALFDFLKAYGLLQDAYDRGPSHADFLRNTAVLQADKARLLSYAVGPVILEIGPGGGTNLAYLDRRRRQDPGLRRLLAIEGSHRTAQVLQRLHQRDSLSAEVFHGNAMDARALLARAGVRQVDTIVLSSILHEVFSYLPYGGRRYNLDSARDFLAGCLSLLSPGARLLIRDPVEPQDGFKRQRLVLKGRPAQEAFRLFLRRFEPRPVPYAAGGEIGRTLPAVLRRRDIAEFIFKLSWGPAAFPYELQEQYGVLSRAGWEALVLDAAARAGAMVRFLSLPPGLSSYLQDGYRRVLAPQVEILEEGGSPAPWPHSNMAMVVERVH